MDDEEVEKNRPPPPTGSGGGPIQRLISNKESPWHAFNAKVEVEGSFKRFADEKSVRGGGGVWLSAEKADTHLALTWDRLIVANTEYSSPEIDIRRVEHLSTIMVDVDTDLKRIKVNTSAGLEATYTLGKNEKLEVLEKFKAEMAKARERYRFIPNNDSLEKDFFNAKINIEEALYGSGGKEFLINREPGAAWDERSVEEAANLVKEFLKIGGTKKSPEKKPDAKKQSADKSGDEPKKQSAKAPKRVKSSARQPSGTKLTKKKSSTKKSGTDLGKKEEGPNKSKSSTGKDTPKKTKSKSGLSKKKSGVSANKSGVSKKKSGINANKSGVKANKSGTKK